ncbi:GIY-YIG nuclease family protein [Candidatus Viridilinea mediisalina]|nr:GIY-YIG nuclease family protein [Candidatus Viridilinea mediisalina]
MYMLECADGSYYTGSTRDLENRLWQHEQGLGARYTAKRLPVKLVYCEYFDRVDDAFFREKQVQGWSRRKKRVLIEGATEKLPIYSRNYTQHGVLSELVEGDSPRVVAASLAEPVEANEAAPPLASTSSASDMQRRGG